MKIFLTCTQCTVDAFKVTPTQEPLKTYPFELDHSSYYNLECENGHKTTFWLQGVRFELLIDTGLWALHLGFPDLAVVRFYTALEDFKLFFVRSWICHNGLTWEDANGASKLLPRSELQKGAFTYAFEIAKRLQPDCAPKLRAERELEELRNKIVHSGEFLSSEKAKSFCGTILEFMFDLLDWSDTFMSQGMEEARKGIMLEKGKEALKKVPPKTNNGTICIPKILDFAASERTRVSIDEAIERVLSNQAWLRP